MNAPSFWLYFLFHTLPPLNLSFGVKTMCHLSMISFRRGRRGIPLTLLNPILYKANLTLDVPTSQHCRIAHMHACCVCWVGPHTATLNTTQAPIVSGARVAIHVDSYMWRLLRRHYRHITCNERPSHGARIHACHHEGIMAPLMGSPPIIHHGGHYSISNCEVNILNSGLHKGSHQCSSPMDLLWFRAP